jgi:uncharacterized protein YjdB
MLNITGTINEYVKDGKLYNLAKRGEGGELFITVYSNKDKIKYEFILNISFDNSTLSGDPQLQYALPFQTFGENRFLIRKKIQVTEPVSVTDITLNKDSIELDVNGAEQLIATVEPTDATNKAVVWESDDTDIASVDQSGNVLAIAEGTATITVTTEDGNFEAECKVTVSEV